MNELSAKRKFELVELAKDNAREILNGWWHEIGSWDGWLEDGTLTLDEYVWILKHAVPHALVKFDIKEVARED